MQETLYTGLKDCNCK